MAREGDLLVSTRLSNKVDDTMKIDKVLLSVDGDKVELGEPYLKNRVVTATVLKHYLGEKIRIAKFKAKTGYRRVNGFRPSLTQIRIDKLN